MIKTIPTTKLSSFGIIEIKVVCSEGQRDFGCAGQTREGKDACNDVTMLCLEADEQLSILSPETAFRYGRNSREVLKKQLKWFVWSG